MFMMHTYVYTQWLCSFIFYNAMRCSPPEFDNGLLILIPYRDYQIRLLRENLRIDLMAIASSYSPQSHFQKTLSLMLFSLSSLYFVFFPVLQSGAAIIPVIAYIRPFKGGWNIGNNIR